jgi:hypothetical protein
MQSKKSNIILGFVSVRFHASHGFFGGYLLLNELGRPLEFHCTLPLQPTRAQQILYGPTLNEFVCGEQIGRALVTKAKGTADLLLVDNLCALTLRHMHSVPLAYLDSESDLSSPLAHPESNRAEFYSFQARKEQWKTLPEYDSDAQAFLKVFAEASVDIDLTEPFGRIEEALQEAHPTTKAA